MSSKSINCGTICHLNVFDLMFVVQSNYTFNKMKIVNRMTHKRQAG